MLIKYLGPALDYSGYGEAVRHDLGSLNAVGIDFITEIPRYTLEVAEFGKLGQMAADATKNTGEYHIKILHTTPNAFEQYIEPGKYHIGRVFWETDRLPDDFVQGCQLVDEIWTGSKHNEEALINSGINKPIYIIPQAIDVSTDYASIQPYEIAHKNDFKFYSIFEWTERKNPKALIRSFLEEFKDTDGVSLTIKTYVDNFTIAKREEILNQIRDIRTSLGITKPDIYVYIGLLTRSDMYRFHKTFDAFVSTHRGEGWGIPQMEAMLMDKPVISTGIGGIHEYLTDGQEAYLLPYTIAPVQNSRNLMWYTSDQKWAEVDYQALRRAMRGLYEDRALAPTMPAKAFNKIFDLFNFQVVGSAMKKRLEEINII